MGDALGVFLFQPPEEDLALLSAEAHRPYISLVTSNGHRIPALYLNNYARITVLFSHGNAEDLQQILPWLELLSVNINVNLLAYDYPGYGTSSDSPMSEEACRDAAETAFNYLVNNRGIHRGNIILYGRSLGAVVSTFLTGKLCKLGTPPCGLIIQSIPLSAFRVAFRLEDDWDIPGDRIDSIRYVKNIETPTLVIHFLNFTHFTIIHGLLDTLVPTWHGKTFYNSIKKQYRVAPLWIENAGHNDVELVCLKDGSLFLRISHFLDEVAAFKRDGYLVENNVDDNTSTLLMKDSSEMNKQNINQNSNSNSETKVDI